MIPPGKGAAFVRLLKRRYMEEIRRHDRHIIASLPRNVLKEAILRTLGHAGDQGLTASDLVVAVEDRVGQFHQGYQSHSMARAVRARLPGLMRHWYIEPVPHSRGDERRYRLANRQLAQQTYIAKRFRHLLAFPPTCP